MLAVDRLKTDENYTASGGFSDVFHGTYNGLDVCIKRLRVSSTDIPGRVTKGRIHLGYRQSFAVI